MERHIKWPSHFLRDVPCGSRTPKGDPENAVAKYTVVRLWYRDFEFQRGPTDTLISYFTGQSVDVSLSGWLTKVRNGMSLSNMSSQLRSQS